MEERSSRADASRADASRDDASSSPSSSSRETVGARTCLGVLTFDDRRESRREVPVRARDDDATRETDERDDRAQTCYGVSRRVDDALVRDGEEADARRVHRTGDVLGRYRYACAGYAARAIPFYPEGRRRPTLEERKRGTEFPMCQGMEILVAEKVSDRLARDASAGDAARRGRRAADGEEDDGRAREEANDLASAAREGLRRWNKSAGKIASNMNRHARFVGDAFYSLVVGRR